MPPALLIIADDLTGANDTGVQFARQGIETLVIIDPQHDLATTDCQVLVVNTESRHCAPNEAYARVYQVARQGVQLNIPRFYKKTDSTLRGNIGSELAALMAATGAWELFFAPAYPKLHRTTRNGVQFVNGVPLHQSSFAADPFNPLAESSIAALIAQQTNVPVRGWEAITTDASTAMIFLADASTDEDLQRLAHQLKDKTLLAGSAGLAEFLPEALGLATKVVEPPPLALPLLVVNGSLHEASLSQVAYAQQQGWTVIEAAPDVAVAQVATALKTAKRVVLTTTPALRHDQFTRRLAQLVAALLNEMPLRHLAIFGGDTLAAIAAACGWKAFRPCAEFQPGIALVQVCGQDALLLLTKAGGFGSLDIISRIPQR